MTDWLNTKIVKDQQPAGKIYKQTGLYDNGVRQYAVPEVTQHGDTIVTSYNRKGNKRITKFNGDDREIIFNGYTDPNTSKEEYIETAPINEEQAAAYDQEAVRNSSALDYETNTEWVKRILGNIKNRFRAAFSGYHPIVPVRKSPAYPGNPMLQDLYQGIYKHGGRLIRQDGKIIEVPFENNK